MLPFDILFDGSWRIQLEARIPFPTEEEIELSNVLSDTVAAGVANALRFMHL